MQSVSGNHFGYLEGDESIFVNGEPSPGIIGTGTEDYFSSGWYYITGEYSAPYHGVTVKDEERGRINSYRWHIEDPIPFKKASGSRSNTGAQTTSPGWNMHPWPSGIRLKWNERCCWRQSDLL